MAVYDDLAEHYDASRGGEQRGDDYAAELDRRLPPGGGPVLEVGVGTGVVALGLIRRGRVVIGLDIAAAMLERARARRAGQLVRGDARRLPFADASLRQVVSVWVAHTVDPPAALLAEVARVLRPGGRYLVCPTNRAAPGDPIDPILSAMWARVEPLVPARQRHVSATDIMTWGTEAGFAGHAEPLRSRTWLTSAAEEAEAIRDRAWRDLRDLDDDAFHATVQPALDALAALPAGPIERRAEGDVVVLMAP